MCKRLCAFFSIVLVLGFSLALLGSEKATNYFPSTIDSFWIYEDQDGNELKRTVVEGEEIAGEMFHAFEYEPELEDYANYSCFFYPLLYQISDKGIRLVDSHEIQRGYEKRLTNEMESFLIIVKADEPNYADEISFNIKAKCEDTIHLLLEPITLNEEWDVKKITANITMVESGGEVFSIDFTIMETGIILETETVETAAGKFEDCLKVEYRTETSTAFTQEVNPDEVDPPGETVTKVWFAPNVGIVKVHQKMDYTFLEMLPDEENFTLLPAPTPKTLELKDYEIKKEQPKNENGE